MPSVTIRPGKGLTGRLILPASKSYSIRACIVAACGGRSRILGLSDCDDARAALRAARGLGASVRRETGWIEIESRGLRFPRRIDVGESGTVLRFLLPLLALGGRPVRVEGRGTLIGRPNRPLLELLRSRGVDARGTGLEESVPIEIRGGDWHGGGMTLDGGLSSQFVSALLIACPHLEQDSRLRITGRRPVSQTYIAMTNRVLEAAGVCVRRTDDRTFHISGGQRFRGLGRFRVPSDYGLAAFLLAAAALLPSRVTLVGHLPTDWVQADGRILELLRRLGVSLDHSSRSLKVRGPYRLRGGTFSLRDAPDLLPIMAVLALFAEGRTRFTGIAHARVKESDRIRDLAKELRKAGGRVEEAGDSMTITPWSPAERARAAGAAPVVLDPHRDHRLAMAFCVLGLRRAVTVRGIDCVGKSYPGFLRDLKSLGVRVVREAG